MRKASKFMPKREIFPSTRSSILILLAFSGGMVLLIYFYPILIPGILIVIFILMVLDRLNKNKMESLARDRQEESICTFARSFDCRKIDTWIIRAVYEELQNYCTYPRGKLPLRPTDNLMEDLCIDPEELDYCISEEIAYRTGRSLENCEENPFYGKVKTVENLVMFFSHQPFKEF